MTITCGSLFSVIGGFEEGFRRAGIETLWSCEKDKNARAVLSKRFPNAIMLDDVCTADPSKLPRVDIVCGGFPCQDLSVAGKRAGLAGARSGLFHEAMRIVRGVRPSIVILENVPGLLSSNRGLDFAAVLREMGEGWDCAEVAWRVLDSQYFGVAQRRKRVFVVASSRVGCGEQILALAEGVCGDPPSRQQAQSISSTDARKCFASNRESSVAGTLETTCHDYSRADSFNMVVGTIDCHIPKQRAQNARQGHYIPVAYSVREDATAGNFSASESDVSLALQSHQPSVQSHHAQLFITQNTAAFRKSKRAQTVDDHETWIDDGLSNTLNGFDTGDTRTTHAVAFTVGNLNRGAGPSPNTDVFPTLISSQGRGITDQYPSVAIESSSEQVAMVVRRLTPVECERLQGFPDGWTDIGTHDKPTADSHRYKQLGNAVTVNVAEWIGRRIATELKKQ